LIRLPPIPNPSDTDAIVTTLDNGVRVLVLRLPHLATAAVSVFVQRQPARAHANSISHFIEHGVQGTRSRDCQQISLDAERLGAEVNAHTDKDHTAYHMRGLAEHAPLFVRMLGEIVRDSNFPADELERERQVILQELAETEDDAFDTAFQLFDKACWGLHPQAQPVIGRRRNIEAFTREQLQAYVAQQYTGVNTVVAAAGRIDRDAIVREAEAALGGLPPGTPNRVDAPARRRPPPAPHRRLQPGRTSCSASRSPGCWAACKRRRRRGAVRRRHELAAARPDPRAARRSSTTRIARPT
jgi:predicted Zn-dependent peptidase